MEYDQMSMSLFEYQVAQIIEASTTMLSKSDWFPLYEYPFPKTGSKEPFTDTE